MRHGLEVGGGPVRWVTAFIDAPAATHDAVLAFWCAMTAGRLSPVRGPGGAFVTVIPPDGDACLRGQRVIEGSGGVHIDLHVDPDEVVAVADQAVILGARECYAEAGLVVLESPGGLPFCVVPADGESRVPSPTRDPRGGRNRLDQVCLDIPAVHLDAEVAFWAGLTGWSLQTGSRPEFSVLERPDTIAWRILLQRRDRAEDGDRVSAHLDFACDDVAGLVERHVAAGARVQKRFAGWTVMADPAGRPYCLTGRDPRTGRRPSGP